MQAIDVPYHIIVFDGEKPRCDCLCTTIVCAQQTISISNLIQKIATELKPIKQYQSIARFLTERQASVVCGPQLTAVTAPDITYSRLYQQQHVSDVNINALIDERKKKNHCFFILIDIDESKKNKHQPKINTQKERNHSSQTSRRKIKRVHIECADDNDEQKSDEIHNHNKPLKRRRKSRVSHVNPSERECLWLLLDASFKSENTTQTYIQTCLETIAKNWKKIRITIALYGIYEYGIKQMNPPLQYTKSNAVSIREKFDSMEVCDIGAVNNQSLMKSINALIDIIKLNEFKMNRIVMFLNKHNNVTSYECSATASTNATLKRNKIIFDCIEANKKEQVTYFHRSNSDIAKLTEKNGGRFWSPCNNISEWKAICQCHDFVYPLKRNVGQNEAIAID